jgi:hypothetical protein
VQVSHAVGKTHAIFDDEHVIAYGGLTWAMRLAERCAPGGLVGEHVGISAADGVNAPARSPRSWPA